MNEFNEPEQGSLQSIFLARLIKLDAKMVLHSCKDTFSTSPLKKQRSKDYIVEVKKFDKNPKISAKRPSMN